MFENIGLIQQLIFAICLNVQESPNPTIPQYYSSCTNALTAASIQSNFTKEVETVQHRIENKVSKEVVSVTGDKVWVVTGFVYATYVKQMVVFNTSIKPLADNLNVSANKTSQTINLGWNF